MKTIRLFVVLSLIATTLTISSCNEKESDVGLGLEDPSTLYDGIRDTVYLTPYIFFDDSLATSGYRIGLLGRTEDPYCGTTCAKFYTQVALPSAGGINVNSSAEVISASLSLKLDDVFTYIRPRPNGRRPYAYNLHIKVHQLAEALNDSTIYYASNTTPINTFNCFVDTTIMFPADSRSLTIPLRSNIYGFLRTSATNEEFVANMKGICIEINENDYDPVMLAVNLDAVDTKLTVKCADSTDTVAYDFLIGYGTTHYSSFSHDYSTSAIPTIQTADSLDYSDYLYLQPMGGTRVKFYLDTAWFSNFCSKHPTAVIHYAELKLPVTDPDTSKMASRLQAFHISSTGFHSLVLDASDPIRYSGFDGYYDAGRKFYRLLLTRHLQNLLRDRHDYGTLLTIESRRSSAYSCRINGNAQAERPRIEIVYSE